MSTPRRGKQVATESSEKSPKHFRWTQQFEDTLLDLLVYESRKGNRPDSSFTATAYRNIVKDFNRIHGTLIMKKHVQSMIKTMKSHFNAFHGAFNGLSGFSWNQESKMFNAEDFLWEQRIQENPKLEKFRHKACHNWDKLFELYGNTRATGAEASALKEKSKSLKRGLDFDDLETDKQQLNQADYAGYESSSYGDHEFSKLDDTPTQTPEFGSTQLSGGSRRSKQKKSSSMMAVMEDGYNTMAESIRELSVALKETGDKVAGSKFDVSQNSQILYALSSLGLEKKYKVMCYFYLNDNPSKAALLVATPNELR